MKSNVEVILTIRNGREIGTKLLIILLLVIVSKFCYANLRPALI